MLATVYKLPPLHYVHVLDNNTCEVATLLGPLSYTLYSYHKVLHDTPQPCIIVPPGHYVKVHNPVHRFASVPDNINHEATNDHLPDKRCVAQIVHGGYELISSNPNATLRHPVYVEVQSGCFEYRFAQDPFPLFPGEVAERVLAMPLLKPQEALLIRVIESYEAKATQYPSILSKNTHLISNKDLIEIESSNGEEEEEEIETEKVIKRVAGEMYVYKGPGKYTPRNEEIIVKTLHALEVHSRELLHLQAHAACVDAHNIPRVAGEE